MKRLRIAFLMPSYPPDSPSCIPVVTRLLAASGVVVDVINVKERAIDLSTVRVEHDLYVLKKIDGAALSIAGALHAQGATIVNPFPVTVALRDKIIACRILQLAGVPTPATYVVSHANQLTALFDEGPIIVKPYNGTDGFGVRIVRNVAELAAVPIGPEPVLAQRYHPPDGRDRKMYSIGGRLFGVKKVFPARTERQKHGEAFAPTPELADIAVRCGRAFGIDFYGIDIIESDRQPYVVDVSSIPGFKGVPDAPSHVAAYFLAAAERAAAGQRVPLPAAVTEAAFTPDLP